MWNINNKITNARSMKVNKNVNNIIIAQLDGC